MEKIDVLIATYNGEKYLKEQLDSILNQTYKNIRIIISDDCSQDNTRKILKEYEKKDSRIQLYLQQKNLGYVKNFEFLLTKVESEIYALSDQDDVWKIDKIERTYKWLKKTNADLVFTDLEVVDEKLEVKHKSFWREKEFYKKIENDKKNNYRGLLLNNYITGCTILTKKSFLRQIIPFPKSRYIAHDYWISIVTSLKGKIEYMEYASIKYRQHGKNSIGDEKRSNNINNFEELRKLFIDVKIDLFNNYREHKELFEEEEVKIIEEAIIYYNRLKDINYINLKNYSLFRKLYKYENLKYQILNFMVLNWPVIAKILFKIKK